MSAERHSNVRATQQAALQGYLQSMLSDATPNNVVAFPTEDAVAASITASNYARWIKGGLATTLLVLIATVAITLLGNRAAIKPATAPFIVNEQSAAPTSISTQNGLPITLNVPAIADVVKTAKPAKAINKKEPPAITIPPATTAAAASVQTITQVTPDWATWRRQLNTGSLETLAQLNDYLNKTPNDRTAQLLWLQQRHKSDRDGAIAQGLQWSQSGGTELRQTTAEYLIQADRAVEAISLLRRSNENIVEHPDYYQLLAVALQMQNQHADALALFNRLLRYDGGNGRLWAGAAISYQALAQPAAARRSWLRALNDQYLPENLRDFAATNLNALSTLESP